MSDRTLLDRLADELARGDYSGRQTTAPTISTPAPDIASLTRVVKELKAAVDYLAGRSGSLLDKAVSLRDLTEAGALRIQLGNKSLGSTTGGMGFTPYVPPTGTEPDPYDPRPYLPIPPTLTDLEANAAFKNCVLVWDMVLYQNHSHVEIWRHTADVIGAATMIGTSTSDLYADASGATGVTYYYWVRAVNQGGAKGAFNAVAGTPATLVSIESADYAALSIGTAALGLAVVDTARIADLAVVDAKVANLNVSKLLAGSIQTTEHIQSYGYTPGLYGWKIWGSGAAEFSDVVVRGDVYANDGVFNGTINAAAGTIGGLEINGDQIIARAGGFMKVIGAPFGSTLQFIEWYGPDLADLDDCTETNAITYLTTGGDAYFGGTLAAGVLKNAAQATSLSATAEVEVGPFLTNGDPKTVVVSYSYVRLLSCDHGTGSASGTGSATVLLERAFGAGAWTTIGTLTVPATPATVEVDPDPGAPDVVTFSMGGSITVTDTSAAASDMKLRARISARTLPTLGGTLSLIHI